MKRPQSSSSQATERMQRQKERDTAPELRIRQLLHAAGFRYRLHRPVPGTRRQIDIALARFRVAVFIDGCFWHSCPAHGTTPRANGAWWRDKLAQNRARDADTDRRLADAGWTSIRIWEHQDPHDAVNALIATLGRSGARTVRQHDIEPASRLRLSP